MLPCEVVQDLLPLYVDEAASDKTKEMVKIHLEFCENCNKDYRKMEQGKDLQKGVLQTSEKFQFFKNRIRKEKRKSVMITTVLVCLIMLLFFYIAIEIPVIPVSDEEFLISKVYLIENEEDIKFFIVYNGVYYDGKSHYLLKAEEKTAGNLELSFQYKRTIASFKKLRAMGNSIEEISLESLPDTVTFAGKKIWSKEINLNDTIPEYIKAYASHDWKSVECNQNDITIEFQNGEKITWDWDGNLLYHSNQAEK